MIHYWEIITRLGIAALAGGIIGLEREQKGHDAGIRTHMLLTMGSALIMLISVEGFTGFTMRDPARLAAQVVSGIGFLCGGVILRSGGSVHGLTTAASLWVSAGIGLAIGVGYYFGAIVMTALVVITLALLAMIQRKFFTKQQLILHVHTTTPQALKPLLKLLNDYQIEVTDMGLEMPDGSERIATYYLRSDKTLDRNKLVTSISELEDIRNVSWQDLH